MTGSTTQDTHTVYVQTGPGAYDYSNVPLTTEQEDAREDFKAALAGFLQGAAWTTAETALRRSGLSSDATEETLFDVIAELAEDGWDDYKPLHPAPVDPPE